MRGDLEMKVLMAMLDSKEPLTTYEISEKIHGIPTNRELDVQRVYQVLMFDIPDMVTQPEAGKFALKRGKE